MSKVLILNESLKSDVAEQPNPRKLSLVIDEYRALDLEENVQIESRDNPRLKQYSVMESSIRRFSFFAIAFTLLSVKVKSINGYIAMWFAPVDNAVSMSDFKSSKVWVGRAKIMSIDTVSKGTAESAEETELISILFLPRMSRNLSEKD